MKIGCKILLLALFLCLGGCVIESRQLQTLRQLFLEPNAELSPHVWEVEFAGYSALVTPVVTDGKTFFVNDSSDLLKFNGWIITEAKGLKRFERSFEDCIGHTRCTRNMTNIAAIGQMSDPQPSNIAL